MKIKVEVECANCGVTFKKDKTEVTRKKAIGKKHYCSLKCCGEANHKHLEPYYGQGDIAKYSKNQVDKYTGLREFMRRTKVRQRSKFVESDITLDDLLDVWNRQNNKCPYSGIDIKLPVNIKSGNDPIHTASLDRIDSSKGYVIDNVQFVSMAINWMKNSMTDEQTKELIALIRALE